MAAKSASEGKVRSGKAAKSVSEVGMRSGMAAKSASEGRMRVEWQQNLLHIAKRSKT